MEEDYLMFGSDEDKDFIEFSDDEVLRYLDKVSSMVVAMNFWINVIQDEEDQEVLNLAVQSIQEIGQWISEDFEVDMKETIRNGHGDFKVIQRKCVERGLV